MNFGSKCPKTVEDLDAWSRAGAEHCADMADEAALFAASALTQESVYERAMEAQQWAGDAAQYATDGQPATEASAWRATNAAQWAASAYLAWPEEL